MCPIDVINYWGNYVFAKEMVSWFAFFLAAHFNLQHNNHREAGSCNKAGIFECDKCPSMVWCTIRKAVVLYESEKQHFSAAQVGCFYLSKFCSLSYLTFLPPIIKTLQGQLSFCSQLSLFKSISTKTINKYGKQLIHDTKWNQYWFCKPIWIPWQPRMTPIQTALPADKSTSS